MTKEQLTTINAEGPARTAINSGQQLNSSWKEKEKKNCTNNWNILEANKKLILNLALIKLHYAWYSQLKLGLNNRSHSLYLVKIVSCQKMLLKYFKQVFKLVCNEINGN